MTAPSSGRHGNAQTEQAIRARTSVPPGGRESRRHDTNGVPLLDVRSPHDPIMSAAGAGCQGGLNRCAAVGHMKVFGLHPSLPRRGCGRYRANGVHSRAVAMLVAEDILPQASQSSLLIMLQKQAIGFYGRQPGKVRKDVILCNTKDVRQQWPIKQSRRTLRVRAFRTQLPLRKSFWGEIHEKNHGDWTS
jgi:hypothetical protein